MLPWLHCIFVVRLWDMQKMDCLACYRGHNYPVWGVAARYSAISLADFYK